MTCLPPGEVLPYRSKVQSGKVVALALACATASGALAADAPQRELLVSIASQELALVEDGVLVGKFPVSTSRFGVGDGPRSYKTPLGRLKVAARLGDGLPEGAVFRRRRPTGEVLPRNARGRDPIVTRILWLDGLEPANHNALRRCIYIHGTPDERRIGKPVSWGCIRMRSADVIQIYETVAVGTPVTIMPGRLPRLPKARARARATIVARVERKSAPASPTPSRVESRTTASIASAVANHGG